MEGAYLSTIPSFLIKGQLKHRFLCAGEADLLSSFGYPSELPIPELWEAYAQF